MTETIRVEAGLAWALVWMAVILFLFSLLWGMLNPHLGTLLDVGANATNTSAVGAETRQAAAQGRGFVTMAWKLGPLWFALGLLYYGFNRAINESKKNP